MEWIQVTKDLSYCCKAPIHYRRVLRENFKSSDPFCSCCGGFPPASPAAIKRVRKLLLSGKLFAKPTYPKQIINPR